MATQTIETIYDFDFEVIGITSQERETRLAWSLNMALDFGLIRVEDHQLFVKSGKSEHCKFESYHEEDNVTLTLLSNKGSNAYLLPEFSRFDYILILDGVPSEIVEMMVKAIRKVNFVLAAFPLEPESLKSKYNLILE
ncbi:MAG: IPExxxVDY family protein [Flavobacteriales bacterium]